MNLRDTLLLVDSSESSQTHLLCKIFEDTFSLSVAETPDQGLMLLKENQERIAAVLLDVEPLREKGEDYPVLSQMNRLDFLKQIPVIVITDRTDTEENEIRAFQFGAAEVITKPCHPTVILHRVQTILELYQNRRHLEEQIAEQSEKLRCANDTMVDALSTLIEYRSKESGKHALRIRSFVQVLLEDISKNFPEYGLDQETIRKITSASALHDIGKISIPDAILHKPGKLTEEEFDIMKTHTTNGCEMLEIITDIGDKEYLRYAYNICRYHHERWDGSGYPDGLAGSAIPICAQVSGLADAYDALTTRQIYKEPYPHEKAVNMILNGECGAFSPQILESFKHVRGSFGMLARKYADDAANFSSYVAAPKPVLQPQTTSVNTLQMAQKKYETLLRYLNASIMELDFDENIYHMIYNPNPDFNMTSSAGSLEEALLEITRNGIHPNDWNLVWMTHNFLSSTFFEEGLDKYTFNYRIFSHSQGEYKNYRVTFLRINVGDFNHRKGLIIWEPTTKIPSSPRPITPNLIQNNEILQGIVSKVLRCLNDNSLTILNGAPALSQMLGYSPKEIASDFHNHLMELIVPEDRERLRKQLEEQLAFGAQIEIEFRCQHKDGNIVWFLNKGWLMTESEGKEFFYCALTDNSKSKEAQEELQWSLKRHEIIRDQTDDIIWEWDLTSNAVTCSNKWEQRFGYPPSTNSPYSLLPLAAHFHPEDLSSFKNQMEQALTETLYLDTEVRILSSRGDYLWNRMRATFLQEEDGTIQKAVGVIIDIHQEKQAAQNLAERAERDPLTKLLNKESSRSQIDHYLQNREGDELSALLIIDMDNFKKVNDNFGHLFGDAVLIQASTELTNLFRSNDVVARIGGDEFMVLMKNIPSRELVEDRCRQLVIRFQNLYREQLEECHLSCSIGIAFVPAETPLFPELFQQADQALYKAKNNGKGCYVIYEHSSFSKQEADGAMDSDEYPSLEDSTLIRHIFRKLHETGNIQATIQSAMELMGRQMDVSRVYILENSPDNETNFNTYEWCSEGASSQITNWQKLIQQLGISNYRKKFNERDIFYCNDIANLPEQEQTILRSQGIKSTLHCAIIDNGKFQGYAGIDECKRTRLWTKDEVNRLSFFARLLTIFLRQNPSQKVQVRIEKQLSQILDQQNTWSFVINEAYEIYFLNKKIRAFLPDLKEDFKCYKGIMNRDDPCENCPAANIWKMKTQEAIVKKEDLGLQLRSEATLIHWEDDDHACLITCHHLNE